MQTNFTSFLFRKSSPRWKPVQPGEHYVARNMATQRCMGENCVRVCVRKYSQTFVIYVIRSVNRMMAARRIGFTLLKTANSFYSNSNSGCGYVQAKLHRRRLLSHTCASVRTMDRANFLPFKLLFIGVKLVEQVKRSAAASAAGSPNCFSFYGQSKYQIKFAMQPASCLSCLRLND